MEEKFMKLALELAKKGEGKVSPNPMVGCVIVKDNKIIGTGYHECYGGNHAEVNAINNANEDVKGATMYVTLEPCAHYGKTPPCAERIVREGIKKVVIGIKDPNKKVRGKGIKILEEGNVEVKFSTLKEECTKINEKFLKYIVEKRPFIALKLASTLDGKIATKTFDSKWISNEDSRAYVQTLRNAYKGILVGVNTVIKDNPKLTCRLENGINPVRIVLDTNGRIPLESNIFKENGSNIILVGENIKEDIVNKLESTRATIIKCPLKDGKIDLNYSLKKLGEIGIDSILIEGGGQVAASFLKENLIDKLYCFISMKIIGGDGINSIGNMGINHISQSKKINNYNITQIKDDILIEAYFQEANLCLQE